MFDRREGPETKNNPQESVKDLKELLTQEPKPVGQIFRKIKLDAISIPGALALILQEKSLLEFMLTKEYQELTAEYLIDIVRQSAIKKDPENFRCIIENESFAQKLAQIQAFDIEKLRDSKRSSPHDLSTNALDIIKREFEKYSNIPSRP